MDSYKILIEGYAHPGEDDQHYVASPSTVLIYSNNKKVLIDPGADKERLLKGLEDENLKPEDIDIIFITHWHVDHFLNIRLFPNHKILDATTLWDDNGGEYFPNNTSPVENIPETNIKVIPTPGHTSDHVSLLIDTENGVVCVAQDVFWWEDGKQKSDIEEELLNLEDPFWTDKEAMIESRKKVLELADWIIPGHGKMFRNPRRV